MKWLDQRVVKPPCPNARPGVLTACNCPGFCNPIYVDKEDPRSDEEIIRDHKKER